MTHKDIKRQRNEAIPSGASCHHEARTPLEQTVLEMYDGWRRYADAYRKRYGINIGNDEALGAAWARIGGGIRGLLNSDMGHLACLLDGYIHDGLRERDFDPDDSPAA